MIPRLRGVVEELLVALALRAFDDSFQTRGGAGAFGQDCVHVLDVSGVVFAVVGFHRGARDVRLKRAGVVWQVGEFELNGHGAPLFTRARISPAPSLVILATTRL